MTQPWGENLALKLVPKEDENSETREKVFNAHKIAKKIGYKKAIDKSRWTGSTTDGEIGTGDIWQAARNGDLNRLRFLIDEKKLVVDLSRWSGVTALHRAAEHGHVEVIEYLVGAGAATSARTTWGWHTPLHLACGRGQYEAAEALLVIDRAQWRVADKSKRLPFDWAKGEGHGLMAMRLLQTYERLEQEW
eukprot:CAMPEP_0185773336 /NCGR_PEP_ID=MMETSP1174-20130828/73057_1 /TAXON_ID=35687 /ORGANISM="Dictyocha speculum, Strain CCMP1381" /LENGTH=190 /DNA_ID=CAMNT_0028459983 /DNA_START=58 /DNA_END=627 /DNA_ORIENTATION=-